MHKTNLFLSLLLIVVFSFNTNAQNAGANDPTFNPTDIGFGNGDGFSGIEVVISALQTDGKIIVGGQFTSHNSLSRYRITRLNADGSSDSTFNPGTGMGNTVQTISIQPDDKIIIGGEFPVVNGLPINRIVRLNEGGSIDSSFNLGTGANNTVYATNIQPDGKIIIGGSFTDYNGITVNRIARLNVDGTLDGIFNTGTGANNTIYTANVQSDGKIIISGDFTSYNGIARNRIARLNSDGTLDATFNPGIGANNIIYTNILQNDGKIIIGGAFTLYNGIFRNHIARLNNDGSLDATFNPSTGSNNVINSLALQNDGKIIIGGQFTSYNGISKNYTARLNTNGSLDTTYNLGSGSNYYINTTIIQPDGKIVIGGAFHTYNGTVRNLIARLNYDGTLDVNFNKGSGANHVIRETNIQPDGKIIIVGDFTAFNETERNCIARLNEDGSIDTTFNPGIGVNFPIYTSCLQLDGKVIIGGEFFSYNGITKNYITRLNNDGSLDTTFNNGTGANNYVFKTILQPDGKIIIGGDFTSYNGTTRNRVARLNTDGTLDTSFNPGLGASDDVWTIALQPDGKIIIGGSFTDYNGIARNRIARLNPDGTLDATFNPGSGVNSFLNTISIQSDGKIIIGGWFTDYNGITVSRIARLNSNGTLDAIFNSGTGANFSIETTAIQPDGKIVIGGTFNTYNGFIRNRLARLNTDGSLDTTFNPGLGTNSSITSTSVLPDGKILISGLFTSFNGTGRNRIARILNCGVTAGYSPIDNSNGNFTFTNTSTGSFNQTHWAFGDGTTSTTANPSHTFSANGTYVVVLTVKDSAVGSSCIDYYLDTIVVTGVVAPLQCAAGFVMYPDAGDVTVVNSSTGSNLSYLWDFGDGNTSNAQFPTHTYATTGNYYLCLTVDDGAGCVDMYCDSIGQNGVVFNKQTGFTINVIAPPLATQINEQTSIINGLTIYPNPSSGIFIIEHSKENIPFIITDISGRVINTGKLTSNKTNIDLSKVQKGVYLLKIGEQTTKLIRQ